MMYASEPMRCEGGLGPRALFYMKVYWFVVPIDSGGDPMLIYIDLIEKATLVGVDHASLPEGVWMSIIHLYGRH